LKYLTGEENKKEIEFKLKPQISFNYLGQFDADVKQISSFEIAKESAGKTQSLRNKREYELDISGMTANNRLTMTISYNETHFKAETIAALAGNFESELKHLIAFCSSKENIEFSPGDFTYKGLSIEVVDRLMGRYPDIEDLYILTPMQEGMLFHALYDKDSSTYFEQLSFRVYGDLDVAVVKKSLDELSGRHEVLRTTFIYDGKGIDRPLQLVLKDRQVEFYYENICNRGGKNGVVETDAILESFKQRDRERSFELSKDVLMRVAILQLDSARYELTWSHHHILMDGWCTGILIAEFFEIYNSYLEKGPYQLPPVKPYRTYIQWLEKQDTEVSGRYWSQYLEGYDEPPVIPRMTLQEPGGRSDIGYKNQHVSFTLDREKTRRLNSLAARNNVTLNTLIQASWGIILGKYSNKQDVVYGAVVSGRPPVIEGVESMVGLFINAIPIRIRWHEKTGLTGLLRRLQQEAVDSEPYHYYPLAEIQSASVLKQNLLDHIMVFENYPIADQIDGLVQSSEKKRSPLPLEISRVETFEQTNYNFNIIVQPAQQLSVQFRYNGYIYERNLIEKISAHFKQLLLQLIANDQLNIESLTLLSAEEKKRILYDFNNTDAQYPKDRTIHELFAEQAAMTPGNIAIVYENIQLTYNELKQRANQLSYVLKEKGVEPDTMAAIMAERSIEMVVAILGILKAGGAYLPIDPDYPEERINYMLKDSNAMVLVTTPGLSEKFEKLSIINCQVLIVNEKRPYRRRLNNPPKEANSINNYQLTIYNLQLEQTNLAYIIYTSGTTGKPKGTPVSHRNVNNYSTWFKREFQIGVDDKFCFAGSFCFDMSVTTLIVPLISGASIFIAREKIERDPRVYTRFLAENRVSIVKLTPIQFRPLQDFIRDEDLGSLRFIILGGEAVDVNDIRHHLSIYKHHRIVNEYGPTEATVATVFHVVSGNDFQDPAAYEPSRSSLPIGRPVSNTRIYILDKNTNLLPPGAVGELCIGGESVAPGYLNKPGLTAEKFIRDVIGHSSLVISSSKFSPNDQCPMTNDRLYRTGDLARWLPDENIEFLGRIDCQVKIRGYRIEPGEIENQLLRNEEINDAVVSARKKEDGEVDLCAYVVTQREFSTAELKEYLASELPAYMIPSYFIRIEKIPLTPNGKVDQKVLQSLDINLYTGTEYAAPGNETEELIAAAWKEVLHNDNIGVLDNYFDVGGHSLNLIRLNGKLNQVFQKDILMVAMFRYPTIRSLARYLDDKKTTEFISDEKIDRSLNIMEETTNYFLGDSDEMM
jgi:amino acid adenylation domain-containing protein/non-ribosomal peptide synthase protein (TIGR01720 family)